ncbi:MAG: hypothetical protein VB015_02800 [Erysipelotrichaceae bacterium]|nr:hypothetical protein [Erysipelotrichaceae bacterium]
MEQTRVKKFKDYRNSLGKSDDAVLKSTKESESEVDDIIQQPASRSPRTTSTVPYDQIMQATDYSKKEETLIAELKKKRLMNTILICVGVLFLLVIIIVIGILIFK